MTMQSADVESEEYLKIIADIAAEREEDLSNEEDSKNPDCPGDPQENKKWYYEEYLPAETEAKRLELNKAIIRAQAAWKNRSLSAPRLKWRTHREGFVQQDQIETENNVLLHGADCDEYEVAISERARIHEEYRKLLEDAKDAEFQA